MANNRLILRTLNSPWIVPTPDLTKGLVLTHSEVDNNFIYLKGENIYSVSSSPSTITLNKVNGSSLTISLSASTNTYTSGTTIVGNTIYFDRNDSLSAYTADLTSVLSGVTLTDGNGTTASGNSVSLGGTLTSNAIINGGGKDLKLGTSTNLLNDIKINSTTGSETYSGGSLTNIASNTPTSFDRKVTDGDAITLFEGYSDSLDLKATKPTLSGESRVYVTPQAVQISQNNTSTGKIGSLFIQPNSNTFYFNDGNVTSGLLMSSTYANYVVSETGGGSSGLIIKPEEFSVFTDNSGLKLTPSATTFTDTRATTKGIEYAADYSTGWTTNSLVTKGYVDSSGGSGTNIASANLTFNATYNADLNGNDWSIKNGSDSYFNIKSTGEFVIGKGAQNLSTSAQKEWNTIIGYNAQTTAANIRGTVSIGYNATTSNTSALAIGEGATASGISSIAILGNATKSDSIAIGNNTNATGNFRTICLGVNSSATYNQAVAIGSNAQATHNYAQAFGTGANATQSSALAVGYLSKSSAIQGIAIGTNNEVVVNHNNSIVIGSGVSNAAGNQLSSTATNQFVVGFDSISPTILIGATTDSYIKSTGNLSLETNTTVKGSDASASTTGFKVTNSADTVSFNVTNDGSVSSISTSAVPSFTARGDGSSVDGYIQLNCWNNNHGIKLKSPPHSAGATYTLTFPNDAGTNGQVLKTDGSGNLSWGTGGGTPTLNNGDIFVGNASNAATSVTMTGDTAISNTGVVTIQSDVVTYDKMQDVTAKSVLGNSTGAGAVAEIPIIEQYISNSGTVAGYLNNTAYWDVNGNYSGSSPSITGTYQGQSHYNGDYWFTAVDDNLWIRLTRG